MKKVVIIGSGFSSLSAACYMAKQGHFVTVIEKNDQLGGRARWFTKDGFTIDMGPSFYWMPDLIDSFFEDFGHRSSDFFNLKRLDPGYVIYFGQGDSIEVPADAQRLYNIFDSLEPNGAEKLKRYLKEAKINYDVAIHRVLEKPGDHIWELIMPETILRFPQFLQSQSHQVKHQFKNPKLQQVLEFPVLFLGAKPSQTPAFYKFMNYVDMRLGTWHIEGGMHGLVDAMVQLGEKLGVNYITGAEVDKLVVRDGKVVSVEAQGQRYGADVVLSGADYHHTESLLPPPYRNYKESYWDKKVMAPSALMYYIGIDKQLKDIWHHTLFFDTSFDEHADCIYSNPQWPKTPLFYTSFPAKSDPSMAPEGKDLAIILIPIAAGLSDTPEIREHYYNQVIDRMEHITQQSIREHVLFQESYSLENFYTDYYAYKGNAYGLANTLFQTACFKPKMRNKKLPNLFYMGQLTVPGPGIPPSVVSGKVAARLAREYVLKTL